MENTENDKNLSTEFERKFEELKKELEEYSKLVEKGYEELDKRSCSCDNCKCSKG